MGKTVQDQLLKLGLVSKKQAGQAKKAKHTAAKQKIKKGGKKEQLDKENAQLARQALEKRKARDKQLNRERDAKLQRRADNAAIVQLVENNKIAKKEDGVAYRFSLCGKIQRIFVAQQTADQLSCGQLGIVALGKSYEVVPEAVLMRIREIDAKLFTYLIEKKGSEADPDDPYAEYQIPDDLMW